MKKIVLILISFYSLNIASQNNIYVCLQDKYHFVKLSNKEHIMPSLNTNTIHIGLSMRYFIQDIDSIVFSKPQYLQGYQVGWESIVPQRQFQYKLPPMKSKTAFYNIQKNDDSFIPSYGVNLFMNFNNPDSLRAFITEYAKRTSNWKLTMRTLTKGRRIPAYNHYVTSRHGGISQESDNDLAISYSDLFNGKSIDDIHKALFYWQNFTPDTDFPLSFADSIALPNQPIFGTFDQERERYQLQLPQMGLTCVINPIYDSYFIKGYTMVLTFSQTEEAQEAYQNIMDNSDKYLDAQLNDNFLTITNYFTDTDEDGNVYPISIIYDYYVQRLIILDLEWNRPLACELMYQ